MNLDKKMKKIILLIAGLIIMLFVMSGCISSTPCQDPCHIEVEYCVEQNKNSSEEIHPCELVWKDCLIKNCAKE